MAATNIGVRSRYRLTPLARIAMISLSAASRPSAMSTPSKKPIGMVKLRTLGSRCSKMLSVSAKDADWLTILWAKRRISFSRMTNVKTPIPKMKLGNTSRKT